MGYAVGYDERWARDVGYGVPATCDHPGCTAEINRGLDYVCGQDVFGGEHGCGLYFCHDHLESAYTPDGNGDLLDDNGEEYPKMCKKCVTSHETGTQQDFFVPTPDLPAWIEHKLTDADWASWRDGHPADVEALQAALDKAS